MYVRASPLGFVMDKNMILETVKIAAPISQENQSGFVVINKSDFTNSMRLYAEPNKAKPEPEKKAFK